MAVEMVAIAVVFGLLAMAVQPSMQQSLRNPLNGIILKPNTYIDYPVGLILLTSGAQRALNNSGLFIPSFYEDISGIIFHGGKINGTKVVYARSGELMVNVATTVQIMVDKFNVRGIVHFGGAGSINDSLVIGDVSVPSKVAYTGAWSWKSYESDKGELSFGDFNHPKGSNLLGRILYWSATWFTGHQKKNSAFWLPVNSNWLRIAYKLRGLELEKCVNSTTCVSYTPEIVFGLKAGSADMFIINKAYGEFLFNTFNISTVDTSDAAIALTCFSNKLPYIVFRGVSNIVKEEDPKSTFYPLGNKNSLKAAAAFLGLLNLPKMANE